MKRNPVLFPKALRILSSVGNNLKTARLRRRLSMAMVAERAGISVTTLRSVERGIPTVSMGTYVQVLFVLGLHDDLLQLAADDELGRKLSDADLLAGKRAPKRGSHGQGPE